MAIHFHNLQIDFKLKNKAKLKSWVKHIAEFEKKTIDTLNYIFTTDEELLQKNKQFLNHTTLTDIITFDYCEGNMLDPFHNSQNLYPSHREVAGRGYKKPNNEMGLISGDIFISIERVTENAKKFNVEFIEELHRVIIHGTLHLCGYKDKTKATATLMRKKEDWALRKLKL